MKIILHYFLLSLAFVPYVLASQASIDDIVQNSDLIVEGKLIQQNSFLKNSEGYTIICTENKILVSKIFKGEPQNDTVSIVTFGGVYEGQYQLIPDAASISYMTEGLFFTSIREDGKYYFSYPKMPYVYYEIENISFKAKVFDEIYTNPNLLYKVISNRTGLPFTKIRDNSLDKSIQNWLENNLSISTERSTTASILFSFNNVTLDEGKVKFDIMVNASQENIKFASSEIYITYSTDAFGLDVVFNEKIEAVKEVVIMNNVYNLEVLDVDYNKVKLRVLSGSDVNSLELLSLFQEKFINVELDIENIYDLATVSFDENSMSNQSFFYDSATDEYIPFNKVSADFSFLPFIIPQITSITPDVVPGGTQLPEHVISITGQMFGDFNNDSGDFDPSLCGECGVIFPNGDASGPNNVIARAPDILTWSDELITLRVPSMTEYIVGSGSPGFRRPAMSGGVRVVNPAGTSGSVNIHIPYSVLNLRVSPTSPIFRTVMRRSNADGINFKYSSNVNGELKNLFKTSAEIWCNQTSVAWKIDAEESNIQESSPADNINLISEEPSSNFGEAVTALMRYGFSYTSFCTNGQGEPVLYMEQIDLAFNEDEVDDPFSDDFDSRVRNRIVHELGHAHLLQHSREPSTNNSAEYIMLANMSIFNDEFRVPQMDDVEGGIAMFTNSSSQLTGGTCSNIEPIFQGGECDGSLNSIISHSEKVSSIDVYPNPNNTRYANIKLNLLSRSSVALELYDVLGRKLNRKHLESFYSGENNIAFSISDLVAGTYFLHIAVGNELYVETLIVL